MSLPVRGAWIEMFQTRLAKLLLSSLPVRGAWIEIVSSERQTTSGLCRSPCGERGLKWHVCHVNPFAWQSLPVRGAWIEILLRCKPGRLSASLPVRGAWIEIAHALGILRAAEVAPRAGSVD